MPPQLLESHDSAVAGGVGGGAGEIIECFGRDADEVRGDEGCALGGALDAVLEAAFPFENGPACVAGSSEAREDLLEIYLTIAEGTEAPRALCPTEVATVDTGLGAGTEFGIFDVEGFDLGGIGIDEAYIVHALQDEVRGIVVDGDPGMVVGGIEKLLKGGTIVEVLARVEFVGHIDAKFVSIVEDRHPALGEFFEAFFD